MGRKNDVQASIQPTSLSLDETAIEKATFIRIVLVMIPVIIIIVAILMPEPPLPNSYDFSAVTLEGEVYSSADFEGEAYALILTASYCELCEDTMFAMNEVIPEGKFFIISIWPPDDYLNSSADVESARLNVQDWRERIATRASEGGREPVTRPFAPVMHLGDDYETKTIPMEVFVNKEGKVIYAESGYIEQNSQVRKLWNQAND